MTPTTNSVEPTISATETLRRLLDERGVEWTDGGFPTTATEWCANGVVWHGLLRDGTIELVAMLTPKQAVEATLGPLTERATKDSEKDSDGRGECHVEETDTWECVCDQIGRYGKRVTIHVMECSACGQTFEHVNGGYEHCPRCGAVIREG